MRIANILVVAAVAIAPVAEGAATGDKTHALDAAPAKQRIWWDTTWNDPYVADIADADTYLRRKFRQDVTDPTTGVGADALKDMLSDIVTSGKMSGESWWITKAKCFAAQVERESIDVSPLDWFPAIAVWDRWSRPITGVIKNRASEVNREKLSDLLCAEWRAGNADGTWNMWQDFDHSVPDWRVILKLGFPGMKDRLGRYAVNGEPFYEGLQIAMDAMLAGIGRFIAQGKKNLEVISRKGRKDPMPSADEYNSALSASLREKKRLEKEIACLERLRNGPPQTAYDAMMFVWLYFFGRSILMASSAARFRNSMFFFLRITRPTSPPGVPMKRNFASN